jgi:nucleoside-diphosphate-sugar epimerase
MPTLLTGGNGWVPSHILRRLLRRGETVVSYDLMPPDDMLREFLGDLAGRAVFVEGDVTDEARLRDVALAHDVERIIHAAVITPRLERERSEPARVIQVNLMGTVAVLEVARSLPGLTRMVYISSIAAWGGTQPPDGRPDEDTPSGARSLYGITKHTSERFCQRYKELFGLDIVAMRPVSVYGPMERVTPGYSGATELREILRLVAAGQPVLVNSLAGPYHDWTFVEDIAEAIERAWDTPNLPHDVYTITAGQSYSIGDMLAAFQRHWPGMEYRVVPREQANYVVSGDPDFPRPGNERLRKDFGWTPTTSLDDGVRQYLAWIRRYGPQ